MSFQSSITTRPSITDPTLMWQNRRSTETNAAGGKGNQLDHEHLDGMVAPAVESCTAAIRSLSPPSVKSISSSSSSPLILSIRNRRSSITSGSTNFSLPIPNPADLYYLDDDEDSLENASHKKSPSVRSPEPKGSEPSTSTSIAAKRITLRRHQTMISYPSEFMRTLEFSSKRGVSSFKSSIDRKSIVFAPDNYVPSPSREDCQILPCANFVPKPDDTTKRITPQTVVDVLDGKYKDHYDLLYIIDCRFPYEFKGGHIRSALNINTMDQLESLLLQPATTDKRVLLIFHCEFSCERGPRMARHLRNQDRAANVMHYPAVFYPEVYVMQSGYSGFFKENRSYCSPEAYVKMQDEKHSKEFEEHMQTFGHEFLRTASRGFLGMEPMKTTIRGSEGSAPSLSLLKSTETPVLRTSSSRHSNVEASVTKAVTSTSSRITTSSITTSISDDHLKAIVPKSQNKAFTTVISSIRGGPSLPSNRPGLTLRPSHIQQPPRIAANSSRPVITKDKGHFKAGSAKTTDVRADSGLGSNSHSNSNAFFSRFRQTKPGFKDVPP
ncbi:cell division cycle- protein [Modicella reniformis]|uniref:M-phase inducer phosphatase n=1 Tax=Modicella reniformis TaxID=1440133 RepID=A0A9P6LTH9_9FUNG|nr:cell division cycle- protein [Modicella reniformis]